MGNMVWGWGLSSSIALASGTGGSALNIIEKVTGRIAGLNQSIFTAYNLGPTVLVFCLIPLMLVAIAPGEAEMKRIDPELLKRQNASPEPESRPKNFASALENTPLFTLLLVAMGIAYEANVVATRGFTLDIN